MKKIIEKKRLSLTKEQLRVLTVPKLGEVVGGRPHNTCGCGTDSGNPYCTIPGSQDC